MAERISHPKRGTGTKRAHKVHHDCGSKVTARQWACLVQTQRLELLALGEKIDGRTNITPSKVTARQWACLVQTQRLELLALGEKILGVIFVPPSIFSPSASNSSLCV